MNRKELLLVSIGIFLTVIASLIADIYHLNVDTKRTEQIEVPKLENYKVDSELLNILERKSL